MTHGAGRLHKAGLAHAVGHADGPGVRDHRTKELKPGVADGGRIEEVSRGMV